MPVPFCTGGAGCQPACRHFCCRTSPGDAHSSLPHAVPQNTGRCSSAGCVPGPPLDLCPDSFTPCKLPSFCTRVCLLFHPPESSALPSSITQTYPQSFGWHFSLRAPGQLRAVAGAGAGASFPWRALPAAELCMLNCSAISTLIKITMCKVLS